MIDTAAGVGDCRWIELADLLADLPARLRSARTARGLSLRRAASQIGIAHSAVSKIEHGGRCELASAVAIARWLAATPVPSIHDAEASNAMANAHGDRFYPDSPEEAAYFAEHHAAAFVQPRDRRPTDRRGDPK